MCQMESKLTNGLAFIFLSFSVLPDDTHNEKLLLNVDATETEPYLAMCHKPERSYKHGSYKRKNVYVTLPFRAPR